MSKKGAINTVVGFAILIALLAVVLIFIIGPDAILQKVAKAGENLADNVLGGLRKDKPEQTSLQVDEEVLKSYENILSTLRKSGQGPCIAKYEPLTEDFKNFKILLSNIDEGIFVRIENEKGQNAKSTTINGKAACVVGQENAAKNFYNNYLDGTKCISNCQIDYNAIDIEFSSKDSIIINGEERDLEDQNFVYKTQDGNICFFPTSNTFITSRCDADEKGLYDNCLEKLKNEEYTQYISFC